MILNSILTLFFVLLNAFFVMAEFAIVKIRSSQLEMRIKEGSKLAVLAKSMADNLDAYLSATQLGITLASLGLGWIGESVVSEMILEAMAALGFDLDPETAHQIALPVAFATITFLHIVFGELAPKSMAIQSAEKVTLFVSIPLKIFYALFKPFIVVLNSFANFFLKLIGFESVSEEQEIHSSEELQFLIDESQKGGMMDTEEHKLIKNVFDFSRTPVKQIMVPHNQIIGVDYNMHQEEIMTKFIEEGISRMPIWKDTVDHIVGIIYAKDLINMISNKNLIVLQDLIRPTYLVHENDKINKVLAEMQKEHIHLAIVIDDFGGTAGLLTLEDILEEIVGEIQDEYDEEDPFVEKLSDTEFLVDASAAIDDANETLPIDLPESDEYESIGGLIMHKEGRIPELNDVIDLNTYICKIMKRSERKLDKVLMTLKEENNKENEE